MHKFFQIIYKYTMLLLYFMHQEDLWTTKRRLTASIKTLKATLTLILTKCLV